MNPTEGPSPPLRLHAEQTGLLVIDLQERLAAAMPPADLARVGQNVRLLLETAKVLGLPVILTEQYRKGIGPTLPELLAALPPGVEPHEKMHFSCLADPGISAALRAAGRTQWLVVGMETHVCVYQTVRDLVPLVAGVFVPADAVVSRTAENRAVGLDLMGRAGAVVTSTEAAVFDLLHVAGTPAFKALAPLLK